MQKNKKLALNSGIQTYQILTNDDQGRKWLSKSVGGGKQYYK